MKNAVEYTFDDYPNVQVVAYKGANGTLETNLDKILLDLVVNKDKYGHITVSFDTADKYVDINNHYVYDNDSYSMVVSVANLENSKREYYLEIIIKCDEGMGTVFYVDLKHYYKCVIVDNEILTSISQITLLGWYYMCYPIFILNNRSK